MDDPALAARPVECVSSGRFDSRECSVQVQMALKRIIINEISEQQHIELREVEGERRFTIVIGIFEATSIERRVKKIAAPRPLTHDLLVSIVVEMGGELRDIYINELRDGTYFAKLRVAKDGEILEIDCRPSDAIAAAVTADCPIYVAEDVIEAAAGE